MEGEEGAHDLCKTVKNNLLPQGHTSNDWASLFQFIINKETELSNTEKKALTLACKMAKTEPNILDGWNGVSLNETDLSSAWSGAYQLFGASWAMAALGVRFDKATEPVLKVPKYKVKTPDTPKEETKPEAKPPLKLAKSNPYYIERLPPSAPVGKIKKKHWTKVTYLKLKLASYWEKQSSSYPEALTNMLTEWGAVVTLLCSQDPKCTVVLPWSDRDFGRTPLTQTLKKPLTKLGVAKVYTDEFFLSTRQGGQFLRFRLGHHKPISFYVENPDVINGLQEDSAIYVD
jgi:hypothetical protein